MTKILTIIPYAFYPPQNGGSLRCFYILREMALAHELYLLTVQPVSDFKEDGEPTFPKNVTIISISNAKPFQTIFNILPRKLAEAINYRLLKKSLRTKANSYFLQAYPRLLQTLKDIQPGIVYYENLEAVDHFAVVVKKQLPSARQIYDAHNVDSELWRQLAIAQNDPMLDTYAASALKTEKGLHALVDGVFCCSAHDREQLMQMNRQQLNISVIPNGVDCHTKAFDTNDEKYMSAEILFCGGLEYYPNEEGIIWFYKEVFPLIKNAMPHVKLTLVGTSMVKESYQMLLNDPSVQFEGRVADVQPFYYRAAVCIAPLLSGSGTRLKILEAMSFGNPVISTSVGAEGLNYVANENLLLADLPDTFAEQVIMLLKNNELFNKIRNAARERVTASYDWNKIGTQINEYLYEIT